MRLQVPLRPTVLAAAAALALGAAGPAAATTDIDQPPRAATVAPPVRSDALRGAVSSAVAELLATIKADGRLSEAATEAFDAKIAKAVAAIKDDAMKDWPVDTPQADPPALDPPVLDPPVLDPPALDLPAESSAPVR
ncbi:hypothetical protein ABT034_27280 [Streptomyces sp. NPDC002773]|uniref:hypothetical protein n=1 Tax=Streptomyces sp. NPDC002773 TaxID=3154430 RepID=UPI003330D075